MSFKNLLVLTCSAKNEAMKFLSLTLALLTLSLSAQASYECKIHNVIAGVAIPGAIHTLKFDNNKNAISEVWQIRLANIDSKTDQSYRYAYYMDTRTGCIEGKCGLEGTIYKAEYKVLDDGAEITQNYDLDMSIFTIGGKNKIDLKLSEEGIEKTVRVSCKY